MAAYLLSAQESAQHACASAGAGGRAPARSGRLGRPGCHRPCAGRGGTVLLNGQALVVVTAREGVPCVLAAIAIGQAAGCAAAALIVLKLRVGLLALEVLAVQL